MHGCNATVRGFPLWICSEPDSRCSPVPRGAPWASAADSVSTSLRIPIDVHRIGADADVRDIEGQWAQLTRLAPDGALLVRPDDIVAWRADAVDQSPEKELRRVLCRILGRR